VSEEENIQKILKKIKTQIIEGGPGNVYIPAQTFLEIIESRERKAFLAAWSYCGEASIEDYDKVFDDYKASKEYLSEEIAKDE